METAILFFECENCGQPFDIEITSGNFRYIKIDEPEKAEQKYTYELRSEFYCCGKNIEIKINVKRHSAEGHSRHELYCKGLRNLKISGDLDAIINEVCAEEFQVS